jgi:hypothetical protein
MTESIESRLNFSDSKGNSSAVELEAGREEAYYQNVFVEYCEKNGIDCSEDNCSAMIMSDYGAENDTFWFWIDK